MHGCGCEATAAAAALEWCGCGFWFGYYVSTPKQVRSECRCRRGCGVCSLFSLVGEFVDATVGEGMSVGAGMQQAQVGLYDLGIGGGEGVGGLQPASDSGAARTDARRPSMLSKGRGYLAA